MVSKLAMYPENYTKGNNKSRLKVEAVLVSPAIVASTIPMADPHYKFKAIIRYI